MIQTVPQSSNKQPVNLLVRLNNQYHKLHLSLNIEKFTQKIMWNYFSAGKFYEPEESKFLEQVLKPGDTFIDIGAHIGYYSLLAAILVGDSGRVISIEPDSVNVNWIQEHIALNQFSQMQVIPTVLGAETKEVEFFFNSDNDGGHALWDVGMHSHNTISRDRPQILTLPMTTLDEVLRNQSLTGIKLIKIDAEGAEYQVLQGALQTISTYQVPYIICEINRFALEKMGTHEKQVRDLMTSLNYSPYLLRNEAPHWVKLSPNQYYNSQYVFNLVFALNESI
jgi:FkbM family methyltransferase